MIIHTFIIIDVSQQVGVILVDYIVFTLPALIVLEVDLNAERNENVSITKYQSFIKTM